MPQPEKEKKDGASQEYFNALTDEDKAAVLSYVWEVDGSRESIQRIRNFQEKIKYSVDPVEIDGMSLDLKDYIDRESIQVFGILDEWILQIMTGIEFAKQEYIVTQLHSSDAQDEWVGDVSENVDIQRIDQMIQRESVQNLLASYEWNFTLERIEDGLELSWEVERNNTMSRRARYIYFNKPELMIHLESEKALIDWITNSLEQEWILKEGDWEISAEQTVSEQSEDQVETETTVEEGILQITEEAPDISDKIFDYYKKHLSTYLHAENRAMVEDVLGFKGVPDLESREHMAFVVMKVKAFQEKHDDLENDGYIGRKTLWKIIDVHIEENHRELNFDETEYRSTVEMEMKSEWGKENADSQLWEWFVEWEFTSLTQLIKVATQSYEWPVVNSDGDIVVFRLWEDSYSYDGIALELPVEHDIKKEYTAFHKSWATSDAINPDEWLINEWFKNHRYALWVLRNGNMVQFHDISKWSWALSPLATQHHGSSLNLGTIAIEMTSRNIQDWKYAKGIDGLGYVETEEINQNQMVSGRMLAQSLGLKIIDSLDPLINQNGDFVSQYIHNWEKKYAHADHFNDDIMRYFWAQIRDERRKYFYEEVWDSSKFLNGSIFPQDTQNS